MTKREFIKSVQPLKHEILNTSDVEKIKSILKEIVKRAETFINDPESMIDNSVDIDIKKQSLNFLKSDAFEKDEIDIFQVMASIAKVSTSLTGYGPEEIMKIEKQ